VLLAATAAAGSAPPPLPQLTAAQSAEVRQEVARYRADTEARVASGEITPDEAELLIAWREWQLARQIAGLAPRPPQQVIVAPTYSAPYSAPAPYYGPYYGPYSAPAPYYGPYYGPYYAPRAPVYWGLSLCAGGAYRSGWGSICL
jgi:hypothetical protein